MANFPKKILIFFILILAIGLDMSRSDVYRVGGLAGWTNIGLVNYKTWASAKNFHVGDVIVFQYNIRFHDVIRVSHQDFNSCNPDEAYETFTSGNDSFVVKSPGHFYFICSIAGHCDSGQRVDIRVPKEEDDAAGAPSPATRCIGDPPATVPLPYKSQPREESQPPPSRPARPPAASQTSSYSTSSVYSLKYCVVVLLASCYFSMGLISW